MNAPSPTTADVIATVRTFIEERTLHNRALGIRLLDGGQATAICAVERPPSLPADPDMGIALEHVVPDVVASLVDVASGAAVCLRLGRLTGLATLGLRLDWLRPPVAGRTLTAQAQCYQVGGSIAFARAIAHDGDPDDPVAAGQSTFMIDPAAVPVSVSAQATPPYLPAADLKRPLRAEGAVSRMVYAPELLGISALHGGAVAGLLESAASLELKSHFPQDRRPDLVTLTIEYLRPGRPEDALARASVTRVGRRTAMMRVEAWQGDPGDLIATAHATFVLRSGA
jgi:uncharacterized protein (TIGR00369 family)